MQPNPVSMQLDKSASGDDDAATVRFRTSFFHAAVGLAQVATDGRFMEVNERFCSIVGYSRAELLATTFQALTHPDDIAEGVEKGEAVLAGEVPEFSIEKRYVRKDGSIVWASLTVSLVRDEKGAADFRLAVVEDITMRKQAEESVRAKAAELQTLIETVPAAVWLAKDPEVRVVYGNRFASELLGMSADANHSLSAPEAERPSHIRFFHDGQDVSATDLPLQRAARGEEVRGVELEARLADGRSIVLLSNATPLRDQAGKVVGAVNAAIDITSRKQAEQALRESEMRLRLAVDAGRLAVWEFDAEDWEFLGSDAFSAILGASHRKSWAYHDFAAHVHTDDEPRVRELIAEAVRGGGEIDADFRVVSPHERDRWITLRGSGVQEDSRHKLVGVVADITLRKNADAERARSEFQDLMLRELNHRIANLFTVVLTVVRLTARSHTDVRTCEEALMDRLRSLAATQGLLGRKRSRHATLDELIRLELSPFQSSGSRLAIDGPTVWLDGARAERFAMIIHELVTNAAKYGALSTPEGTLAVNWKLVVRSGGERRLLLEWRELGGPPVIPPSREGFGSTITQKTVETMLGGLARVNYRAEGLYYTLDVPMAPDDAHPAET